ncbi:MAG: GAF domain-containing protein, partial [Anaerolineales bacterium]
MDFDDPGRIFLGKLAEYTGAWLSNGECHHAVSLVLSDRTAGEDRRVNLIAIFSAGGLGVIFALGCALWVNREQLRRLNRDVTRILFLLFVVMAYVFLSNSLEWMGLTNVLDPYEDYAEVVWPLLWGAALYVWIQSSMVNALLHSTRILEHVQHLTAGIMDTSPTGIIVVGRDGNISFANAYAGRIIGISKEDLLQYSYDELAQLLIGHQITPIPREELPFHQVMINKSAIHRVRMPIKSRGGDIRELSINAAPLMDENGDIERVVIVLNDVTDLVQAEYQVTHLNAVLRATRAMSQLVARERNPDQLLEQVCRVLVEARGYRYAWILRSDPHRQFIAAAESGCELPVESMRAALFNHMLPCVAEMEVMETGACRARIINCSECAFQDSDMPGIQQAISVCIEYNKINYGKLVVGVTAGFEVDADESALLQEAATDLAFALYAIEQEKARQQVEANLALKVDAEVNFQERLRTLVEINNELALSGSADELCLRAIEIGTRSLKFDRMGIWLQGELNPQILVGSFGIDEMGNVRDERHIRRKAQDEFARFADAHQAVVTRFVDVELHNQLGEVVGKGMQMTAGIWDGHRFIGLLDIDNLFEQRELDTYDEEILGLFAATLGHLYSRIRAEERLQNALVLHQQRAAQQEALNAIIARAATATELEELVVLVLRRTLLALNLDSGCVWALDVQSSIGSCQGIVEPLLQQVVNSGVDADAILSVEDVKAINIALSVEMYPGWFADVTAALQAHSVHSFLAVPVMSGTERIGGLVFTSDHPVAWTREERGLVAAVAQQLGSTAERITLLAEVQNQVTRMQTVMDAVPDGVILL